jgi:hypothetical protein
MFALPVTVSFYMMMQNLFTFRLWDLVQKVISASVPGMTQLRVLVRSIVKIYDFRFYYDRAGGRIKIL